MRPNSPKHLLWVVVAFAPLVEFRGEAAAADYDSTQLEEVVVTAQKRAENLQVVPVSIAAFSGQQLNQFGITATEELGGITPGLIVNDFGNPVITTFTLRGVSQFNFQDQQESTVPVFVDGSYVPYLSAVGMNLFDLQQVAVLRGPQGTLFGRNATGGVVQVNSAPPTTNFTGYGDVQAGNYGDVRFEGALSGPLSDHIRVRFSLLRDKHDGYFHDLTGPDKGDADNTSWRAQVEVDVGDKGNLLITGRGSRDDTSTAPYRPIPAYPDPATGLYLTGNETQFVSFCESYFGTHPVPGQRDCVSGVPYPTDPFTIEHNRAGRFVRDYYGGSVKFTYDFGPALLTSLTSYGQLTKNYANEDSDGTIADTFFFNQFADAHDISEELRLEGKTDRTRWTVGFYGLEIGGDYSGPVGLAPARPVATTVDNLKHQITQTYAGFVQADLRFAPFWTLTLGGRWTEDRKHFTLMPNCEGLGCTLFGFGNPALVQGSGFTDETPGAQTHRQSGNWDGKLQLSYQRNDNALFYAGVTRGTKAGGYNGPGIAVLTPAQMLFKDEVLTDYEAGTKLTLPGGRLRVNAGAFYYHYDDIQVFNQNGPYTYTFNEDGRIYGGEVEMEGNVTNTLHVSLSVALLNSLINPVQFTNILNNEVSAESQELPNAPHTVVYAMIRKTWEAGPGQIMLQVDGSWNGARKLSLIASPATIQDAYGLLNARFGYTLNNGRIEVAAYGHNLTDKVYLIAANPFVDTNGSILGIYGPPRTYGLELRAKF